jgi:hypothetical protein
LSAVRFRFCRELRVDSRTVTPDKGLKKHHLHARAWHGHKVHHAKHATPNQVKHAKKISKKSLTSASTKSHAKTAVAVAPVRNWTWLKEARRGPRGPRRVFFG